MESLKLIRPTIEYKNQVPEELLVNGLFNDTNTMTLSFTSS